MPASSRKRNKGKDRKAKQLAKKEGKDRADAHMMWKRFYGIKKCDHGCAIISDDHPVSSFMDDFFVNVFHNGNVSFDQVVSDSLKKLYQTHTLIWSNEDYRRLAISILLQIGTNLLLREGSSETEINWPLCFAHSIVILEHFDGSGSIYSSWNLRCSVSKRRDLQPDISNTWRDVLKFYRKRVSCKCLKKMHLEARKNKPKIGLCWYCQKKMERVSLSVCSRCMVRQYCSRKCQVADWSKHESDCGIYVGAHKQHSECQDERQQEGNSDVGEPNQKGEGNGNGVEMINPQEYSFHTRI